MNFQEINEQLDSAYKSAFDEIGHLNMNRLESRDLVLISKDTLLRLIANQNYFNYYRRLW